MYHFWVRNQDFLTSNFVSSFQFKTSGLVQFQSAIAEKSEFNFGVCLPTDLCIYQSAIAKQCAEKSSNPDFEANFLLEFKPEKNSGFQTQNFKPENSYFWFTLTGPLSLGKVPKSINRTIKYKSRAKKRRDSIKAYKNFYLLSCTLNDFCLFWSRHLNPFSS